MTADITTLGWRGDPGELVAALVDAADPAAQLARLADRRPAWQNAGACRDHPAELWFPRLGEPTGPAKTICAACSVREECLYFALEHRIEAGVWGGLSGRQRRQLRWPRRPSSAAPEDIACQS